MQTQMYLKDLEKEREEKKKKLSIVSKDDKDTERSILL